PPLSTKEESQTDRLAVGCMPAMQMADLFLRGCSISLSDDGIQNSFASLSHPELVEKPSSVVPSA
ncbi:MAG: hypothetical protein N3G20_09875, partial [Verrucomicrobiae bacterium]|nr:hypothetical protein [Verrucomicrobiae bacterium]